MQHMVNKAFTRLVVGKLISGYLARTGNYKHWTAGHNPGRGGALKTADVQVFGGRNPIQGGR